MEWRYGILDVANLKLTSLFDQPLTVTLGRQDVMDVLNMRNGWLVFDGTPGDGSWSFFMDGARAAFDAKAIKTKFDVSYISMHAYAGEVIPTIGNSSSFNAAGGYTGYLLTEQDEQGAVLSIANNSIENMTLGGYFIYKDDTRVQGVPNGDNANIGGTDEMFDVLWARWPRWSEMYIYSYPNETSGKIAQLNNVGRVGPMWTFSPMKGMAFSVMYNALFAPESVPTRTVNRSLFSMDGNFRGHYLQAILRHKFSEHVSAHLWGEWVFEGDYYAQRDVMTFLRAEVLLTF